MPRHLRCGYFLLAPWNFLFGALKLFAWGAETFCLHRWNFLPSPNVIIERTERVLTIRSRIWIRWVSLCRGSWVALSIRQLLSALCDIVENFVSIIKILQRKCCRGASRRCAFPYEDKGSVQPRRPNSLDSRWEGRDHKSRPSFWVSYACLLFHSLQ